MNYTRLKCGDVYLKKTKFGHVPTPWQCGHCDECKREKTRYRDWKRAEKMMSDAVLLFGDAPVVCMVYIPRDKWEAFKLFVGRHQVFVYNVTITSDGFHVVFIKGGERHKKKIERYYAAKIADFWLDGIEELAHGVSTRDDAHQRLKQFKHMEDKLYRSKHKPFTLSRCTWNGRIPMMKDAEIRGAFMGMSNQLIDTELALEISNEDDPQRIADLMEKFNYELAIAEMRVMNDMNGGVNHFKAVAIDGDEQNGSVYACQKQFAKIAQTQQDNADKAIKKLEKLLIEKGYIQSIGAIFGD